MNTNKIAQFQLKAQSKKTTPMTILDDGQYTCVSNGLLEALYTVRELSPTQKDILVYIARQTWGWQRDTFKLVSKDAATLLGVSPQSFSRNIRQLLAAKVLKQEALEVGINPYVPQWSREILSQTINPKKTRPEMQDLHPDATRTCTQMQVEDASNRCAATAGGSPKENLKEKEIMERDKSLSPPIPSEVGEAGELLTVAPQPPADKKPKQQPTEEELMAGFDEWWAAYPKKEGKKAAKKGWKKFHLGTNTKRREKFLAVFEWKKANTWADRGRQYWPDPINFLKEEYWTEDLSELGASLKEETAKPKSRFALENFGLKGGR